MKARQIEDAWRHVAEPRYPIRLTRFDFARVDGFRDGTLTFTSGVNVVCGGNGVGKSTLLHALFGLLRTTGADCAAALRQGAKTANAVLDSTIKFGDAPTRVRTENGLATHSLPVGTKLTAHFVDVAAEVISLRKKILETDNLNEALDQVDGAEWKDAALERVAYLMGRSYSKIEVFELDLGENFEEVPFFEVTVGQTAYDSRNMGLGEFTIMYLVWRLERMGGAALALVEEPEVFMSPLSQLRFANVLAEISARRRLWFIVSTHSPALVTQVAEQVGASIGLLQHVPVGGEVVAAARLPALLRSLGMVPNKRFFVMLEDASSIRFLRFLLANEDIEILDETQFVSCGGDADVSGLAQKWEASKGFTLGAVFLLDGDMRQTKANWPTPTRLFLPGAVPAEAIVKSTVEANVGTFAERLGRRDTDVSRVLGEIDGLNIHDWPPALAERLGTTVDTLFTLALSIWGSVEENRGARRAFIADFKAALLASEEAIEVIRH